MYKLRGNLVDVVKRSIYPAEITVENGIIKDIVELEEKVENYLLPGFIDAHVHIESSMLVPSEFARVAVIHGTVATISDPHEIANVMGVEGVDYMIENGKKVPFHFFFGAPSCVPATSFETAGAVIDSKAINELLSKPEIVYLAEMMNFPGVIYKDAEVMAKLDAAKRHGKPIDGHAPGLRGEDMQKYFSQGITTDHECFKYEEGKEKAAFGVNILIREGSAAKNFNELIPLLNEYPKQVMFCSDDKHPDNLIEGHINLLVKRALEKGCDFFDVIRSSSYNVIKHYNLPVGYLQKGQSADFIIVGNLEELNVKATYIKGTLIAEAGKSLIERIEAPIINNFNCSLKKADEFKIEAKGENVRVIEAMDGQLITNELHERLKIEEGVAASDIEKDILKMAVVNRYADAPIATAFIKNVGLKQGAIASCVAHDCHNIVVVGTNDDDMAAAVNAIINARGGISLVNGTEVLTLALPVAGIMTNADAYETAGSYTAIDKRAKELGSTLGAPFMTLSFMALLVIPKLKLSDKGLFDGKEFKFTDVFVG